MKKKIITIMLALMIGGSFIVACGKKSSDSKKKSTREHNDTVEELGEYDGDEEMYGNTAYETTVANYKNNLSMDYADVESEAADEMYQRADPAAPSDGQDVNVDASKEMLVYRCTMSIDTLNFEESLTALKTKIAEFHGFIERETQSDGNNGNGRYIIDEEDKDYYYTATIRIPSAYYESFVSATEGIGTLRSKNSSVDNVATRYGTLKNDLEIYEAEYERYMKQYNETKDEAIALEIQRELRNLSITISDIKTQMSMLESDVAYSYVTVTVHKVTEKEIKKEKEAPKEDDDFGTRVSKKAKESWNNFLGFLESILMFFISGWWAFLLAAIIFLILFFVIRRKVKKSKAAKAASRKALEAQQAAAQAAPQTAVQVSEQAAEKMTEQASEPAAEQASEQAAEKAAEPDVAEDNK
ncbi:MAG TPA: hypothetical protein DCW43_05950 [Clostridiales bacterium]|nr:hypothetical protein [Clostridiales bacterium]